MDLNYPASTDGNFQILTKPIGIPHPYCITPRHIEVASSKFNGKLTEEAIQFAEKNSNAKCGVEGCTLSYDEHGQAAAVKCLVHPEQAKEEIQAYLKEHAQSLESQGMEGIVLVDAFSKQEGETNED